MKRKLIMVHRKSKIIKSGPRYSSVPSYALALFILILSTRLAHEFACAVTMHRKNWCKCHWEVFPQDFTMEKFEGFVKTSISCLSGFMEAKAFRGWSEFLDCV